MVQRARRQRLTRIEIRLQFLSEATLRFCSACIRGKSNVSAHAGLLTVNKTTSLNEQRVARPSCVTMINEVGNELQMCFSLQPTPAVPRLRPTLLLLSKSDQGGLEAAGSDTQG